MAKPKPEPEPILHPFEGRTVTKATISVTAAGDGLSEAMKVDPAEFHHGQTVYVVLETTVDKVRFIPVKDTNMLAREHILKAGTATIVDAELVREVLDEQRGRIEAAKDVQEREDGVRSLADAEEEDDEQAVYRRQHFAGVHATGRVDACPQCDAEAEQEAREAAQP